VWTFFSGASTLPDSLAAGSFSTEGSIIGVDPLTWPSVIFDRVVDMAVSLSPPKSGTQEAMSTAEEKVQTSRED
jgi:hypothetical protein